MRLSGLRVGAVALLMACPGPTDTGKKPQRTTTDSTTVSTTSVSTTASTTVGTPSVWTQGGVITCADPSVRLFNPYQHEQGPEYGPPAIIWAYGAGVGIGDIDGNGFDDVVVPGPDTGGILYNNGGPGLEFRPFDISNTLNSGVSLADYDLDGDIDIFVTRFGKPDRLLRNDGNHQFVDVAPDLGLDGGDTYSLSSAWADFDKDGDLDLVVSGYGYVETGVETLIVEDPADPTRLYKNLGGGQFVDVGASMLPQQAHDGYTFIASWTELNGDDLPDLLFVNDFPQSGFFTGAAINRGSHFEWTEELGLSVARANMGLGVGDTNGDGIDDFMISSWGRLNLLESSAFGVWIDATFARDLTLNISAGQKVAWGAEMADIDNDTDLDMVVGFGYTYGGADEFITGEPLDNPALQPDTVYAREGDSFVQRGAYLGLDNERSNRTVVVSDLNRDGWLDVITRDVKGVTDLNIATCGNKSWVELRLHQDTENPRAVGARIKLSANGVTQYRTIRAGGTGLGSTGALDAHFGLGDATLIDQIEIRWPDGFVEVIEDIAPKQMLDVTRTL